MIRLLALGLAYFVIFFLLTEPRYFFGCTILRAISRSRPALDGALDLDILDLRISHRNNDGCVAAPFGLGVGILSLATPGSVDAPIRPCLSPDSTCPDLSWSEFLFTFLFLVLFLFSFPLSRLWYITRCLISFFLLFLTNPPVSSSTCCHPVDSNRRLFLGLTRLDRVSILWPGV